MSYAWNASKISIQKYCRESFYMEMTLKIASCMHIEPSSNLTPSESKVIWSFGLTYSHPHLTDEEGGAPGLEYIAQADTAGKLLSWNQALLCLGLMTVPFPPHHLMAWWLGSLRWLLPFCLVLLKEFSSGWEGPGCHPADLLGSMGAKMDTVHVHTSASWVSFGRRGGAPTAVSAPRGTSSPHSALCSTEQFVSRNDRPKGAGLSPLAVLLHPGLPHIIIKKFLAGSIARWNTGWPVRFEFQMDNHFFSINLPQVLHGMYLC